MNGNDTQSIDSRIDSWTDYWRSGRDASCFEGSEVEVRLTKLWDEFVDKLHDGARLLDLATGNGTVARTCAGRARVRAIDLRIDAIDAAAIDPPRYVPDPEGLFQNIHFRGGTRLESLPFCDGAFGGIVSQFGFEYADEENAAAEVARCLAPGGHLRFIMHARDGAVARDTDRRLQRLKSVLAENGPLSLVLTLARAAEAGDIATFRSKSACLTAAVDQVRHLQWHPPPDDAALFYSNEFLRLWARRDRYWMADLRRTLENGWANAHGVAIRQEQMLRAARSTEEVARIAARFAAAHLAVDDMRELCDDGHVQIGWLLDAMKPLLISA